MRGHFWKFGTLFRQRNQESADEDDHGSGYPNPSVFFFENIASHENGEDNADLTQADNIADALDCESNQNQRVTGNTDNSGENNSSRPQAPLFFYSGGLFGKEDIRRVIAHPAKQMKKSK